MKLCWLFFRKRGRRVVGLLLSGTLLFSACSNPSSQKQTAEEFRPDLRGDSLIAQSFDTLKHSLMQAVNERGFAGAVEFCSRDASRLTSIYLRPGEKLRRVSDKARNPANRPDSLEKAWLRAYEERARAGMPLPPVLVNDQRGGIHYFKPIVLQAVCLNCHGDPATQVKADTRAMIARLYPDDAATGYKEGDLRGLWHVAFSGQEKK